MCYLQQFKTKEGREHFDHHVQGHCDLNSYGSPNGTKMLTYVDFKLRIVNQGPCLLGHYENIFLTYPVILFGVKVITNTMGN